MMHTMNMKRISQANIKRVLLVALFFLTGIAQAQYTSRRGFFQVDQKKGCASLTVTVSNINPCTPCNLNSGDGTLQQHNTPTFQVVYNTPGTYVLSILYQSVGADDITITVDQNIQPAFDMLTCSGGRATMLINDNNYDEYIIDFNNDGTPDAPISGSKNASFTYPAVPLPNTYAVSVRGRDLNTADNCAAKVQNFNALAMLPATTINTLTVLDGSTIKLDFIAQQDIQYKMEIAVNNSGTFQFLQNVYETNSITIANLKTDDSYYCFRLSTYDPCNSTNTYSNIVCSQNADLTLLNGSNKLDWVTSPLGVVTTDVQRNKGTGSSEINGFPGSPGTYTDNGVICNNNYCYQVVNNYAGGVKSISLEKCGVASKTAIATPVDNGSAVVNTSGTSVDLNWLQDPAFTVSQYNIFKISQIAVTSVPRYTDALYNTSEKTCYRINYEDVCRNRSGQGSLICPLQLFTVVDSKNTITVNWNSYVGWKAGVMNYTLEKYSIQGTLLRTITTTDTVFVDDQPDPANQVFRYIVRAHPNVPTLTTSVSNEAEAIKTANLFAPSAFTPNGDGLNDTFAVNGQFIVKMELNVFDRWGALVFSTVKNEPWNGTREGKPLTEGSYVWKVNITDLAGRTFSSTGTVGLLQKNK